MGGVTGRYGLVLAALLFAGCSGSELERANLETLTAEEIFRLAEGELSRGNAGRAADTFEEIERLYPYSQWSKRAIMMSAFSYHRAGEYDNSRSAAQRYLDFYPADDDAAYAQFLISLSYYCLLYTSDAADD